MIVMNTLETIEKLIEHLTCEAGVLVEERRRMLKEISHLRERLMERDKEAVKAALDMRIELEAARMSALHFEQERIRMETRLGDLNDRLAALVSDDKPYGG